VGDYQYRYIAPVSRAFHDAYVTVSQLLCYHEHHRIISLIATLDAKRAKHEPVSDYYHRQMVQLFTQTLPADTCAAATGAQQMHVLQ
jgi:hypothetical protein